MSIFAVNMKHSPESCPLFNDEVMKKFKESIVNREDIAKKNNLKVLSAYSSVLDHIVNYLVEAPSQQAVEDYFKEMGFAFWNYIEIKQVQFVEDILKRVQ